MEEFERFPWPDPDQMDLSAFEEVKRYLKPGMKVIAYLGYIFTSAWWLMGMETFGEEEVKERIRTIGSGEGYCVASSNSVTAYVPLEPQRHGGSDLINTARIPLSL